MKETLVTLSLALLAGCTPRIEVAPSKEPITINMNVKIDHEIHIKADDNAKQLLEQGDKTASGAAQ